MPEYVVTFSRSARKELERLDSTVVQRVIKLIENLASNPKPRGARKLQAKDDFWRVRVGDYRIIYTVSTHPAIVDIVAVRHRQDAYRN